MSPAVEAAETTSRPGLVLGTAGHIDHGKTALIQALTGIDTDRLPEEKARGITIDLGFAELELPGLGRVSVVDVPGHEGLVRTMVSGASGMDLVLLIVAADEGVMPQTREHVAICNLLGIERGVVALTKIDVADADMVELAGEEVSELLHGTALTGAPVVPVSAHTGDGLDRLIAALTEVTNAAGPRTARSGPPRLCVDRVFAVRGFGTVVTGTLIGDALDVGDDVIILPAGQRSRIRGLQMHGSDTRRIEPGTRCAVNLQGLEVADLHRGDVVTRPDRLQPTTSFDAAIAWLEGAPRGRDVMSVELLCGTSERRARLAPIGGALEPGERGFGRLHVEGDAVALLPGDRFIVRGFARIEGAGATLGGGEVLDVAPPHRRRSDPELQRELAVLSRADLDAALCERVRRAGYKGVDVRELVPETGLTRAECETRLSALAELGEVVACGANAWIGPAVVEHMRAELLAELDAFHAASPMRPGMARAALRGSLPGNAAGEAANLVLTRLESSGMITSEGDLVRRSDHEPILEPAAHAAALRIVEEARGSGLEPPSPRDWAERLDVSPEHFRDLVAHLERKGELVRAPGDLWFARDAVDALCEKVRDHFKANEELDTQSYKSLIGTSRRTAMPLMELLDELRVTRRQGDVRVLRPGASS
ncbi:MAG: selenocysteine-specific translation elongation factor [Deltaproteobacteria bacterium]|nr:selenocysteine-specific translation elongation factor [Deltaproteobacteria bacterium]